MQKVNQKYTFTHKLNFQIPSLFLAQPSRNEMHRIVEYQRQQRIHLCCLQKSIRWRYLMRQEANIGFGHALMPSYHFSVPLHRSLQCCGDVTVWEHSLVWRMSEALYHPDNPIGQIALGTTLRMRKHSIPACRTLFHSNFNSFRKAKANFLCPRKHPAFSVIFFSRVVFNSSSRTRWVIGNVRSRVAGLSWRGTPMIGVLCACACIMWRRRLAACRHVPTVTACDWKFCIRG